MNYSRKFKWRHFICRSISKNKTNLDKLKETIILQAELLDLKASQTGNAKGVVLEAKLTKEKVQ